MTTKRTNLIFGILLTGAIVTSLLQTSLTTALPQIMRELSLTATIAQWLTSAFSLTMAIMVPTTAFLIKRFTTRQTFISAMAFFTIGSLISWWSNSFVFLLIGRILQALGSGIILPLTQVVIMTLYPQKKQGTMMGILGLAAGAAPVIAPTITGLMIDSWGWRSIFLLTGIISIWIIIGATLTLENVTPTEKISLDYISLLLCTCGLIGILWGLSSLVTNLIISLFALIIGSFLIICFSYRELIDAQPFLNIKILKQHNFRLAVIISMLLYAIMMGGSTIYPIIIQTVMNKSAVVSALVMLPGSLLMAIVDPITGYCYDHFGINKLAIIGSILMAISCLGILIINSPKQLFLLCCLYILRLLAVGFLMMPVATWGMQNLSTDEVAHGTALLTALRTLSGAFGTTIFMEIMNNATHFSNPHVTANYTGIKFTFGAMSVLAVIQLFISWYKFNKH